MATNRVEVERRDNMRRRRKAGKRLTDAEGGLCVCLCMCVCVCVNSDCIKTREMGLKICGHCWFVLNEQKKLTLSNSYLYTLTSTMSVHYGINPNLHTNPHIVDVSSWI